MNFKTIFLSTCLILLNSTLSLAQISRTVGEISALEITDRLLVSVVPSDRGEMMIEGEHADQVQVLFEDDGVLRLKMTAGHNLQGHETAVTLYTPTLSKIEVRKGAVANVEQEVLKGDALLFVAREGGKIRALVEAVGIDVSANTGGTVDLLGNTTKINISTTAGGSFYGKDLTSELVHVRVNGGGRTEVHATGSADVETRMGGVIEVYGNPSERRNKTIMGGKINFH
ncbi:MAG: GIN domain-containing protein [Sphingobacterium sp.]